VKERPTRTLRDYCDALFEEQAWHVNREYVRRIFKSWRWSFKKPQFIQLQKYTAHNILYYGDFITWIYDKPWHRLKFLDESHFEANDVSHARAVGPLGSAVVQTREESLSERYSVSALCSFGEDRQPVTFTVRTGSNNQMDFVSFVMQCVHNRELRNGDILLCDNARVHGASDSMPILLMLLEAAGVELIFLPAYSPELSPIELVFGWVKHLLRNSFRTSFLGDILCAFLAIDMPLLGKFYHKCLNF